jgi:3-oxoacyl-[acyl-carrier protein] reductase
VSIVIFGGSGGVGRGLAARLEAGGHEVAALSSADVDITDPGDVSRFFVGADVDAVINAAVYNENATVGNAFAYGQVDVNIHGLHNILNEYIPYARERGGQFIQLSSVLAVSTVPGTGVYSACKAYAEQLIRVAALENARKGIRFNCIRMGYFGVGLNEEIPDEMQNEILRQIPLGRYGNDWDLYQAVNFLLTNEYVTGSTLEITGGL